MTPAKHVLSNVEGTQSTPSSENKKIFFFAPWRLGAINFVELVLFKIWNVRS
jgi:hypothetical protein